MSIEAPLRVSLAELVEDHEGMAPITPFAAFKGERPVIVHQVNSWNVFASRPEASWERTPLRHQFIQVDPRAIKWRTALGGLKPPIGNTPTTTEAAKPEPVAPEGEIMIDTKQERALRRCTKCDKEKPTSEFLKSGQPCLECNRIYQRSYSRESYRRAHPASRAKAIPAEISVTAVTPAAIEIHNVSFNGAQPDLAQTVAAALAELTALREFKRKVLELVNA